MQRSLLATRLPPRTPRLRVIPALYCLSHAARFLLLICAITSRSAAAEPELLPTFQRALHFSEQESWRRLDSGIRVYVSAPLALSAKNRVLVLYATPNGNTIEQTLGCAKADGLDWHYDIQHVAAQIRRWREIAPQEHAILAVVQAPKLSWPAFRQAEIEANTIVHQTVTQLAAELAAERIVLSGHSGGGSFLFGYLDAQETLPPSLERIIFLDANYAYADEQQHGDKLLAWLRGSAARRLITIAYDDREITLNGKKVVSPTGGTYRASQRMLERLKRDVAMTEESLGPFRRHRGLAGQLEFFIHPNPENKILHTILVGEMNGLLQGLSLGTDHEMNGGTFGGPRAYTKWIQAQPAAEPATHALVAKPSDLRLALPAPPKGAIPGSEFLHKIELLSFTERETAIQSEILRGNVPDFLRALVAIDLEATDSQSNKHTATAYVTPDYLAVGNDRDFFRLPMSPQTAQAIADATDCSLITAKLSDDIYRHAQLKLAPHPLTKDREAPSTFYEHHQIIETQRQGHPLGLLVAGIKKDIILTNRLNERANRVALYGWHQPGGQPIQPIYVGHVNTYVDYSHGLRLTSNRLIVDGHPARLSDALKDQTLSNLLTNEGPLTLTRIP
jgi:hypothetical protein